MRNGLRRVRWLLAWLVSSCLLGGCTSVIVGGMVLERAVSYPMRSPEYVLRDLGSNRFLLGQWVVPLNANPVLRVRYYDRSTGLLSPLPETAAVFRNGYLSNILGMLRYESDSPLQIAFFSDRGTGHNIYCEEPDKFAAEQFPERQCGYMHIVLSLDGGRSFAGRRISIPAYMGRGMISPRKYEFAIVRNNTLYLGLYVKGHTIPDACCRSADRNIEDWNRVALARGFEGTAVADRYDVYLSVLAMPLPGNGDEPLPAEQIPWKLGAYGLTGLALLTFDLGQPMARLETPPPAAPRPPIAQYKRAHREAYIESLRAEFPEWAAHQTLDDIPRRERWMTSKEIAGLSAKLAPRGNDPVEWVRFDRPASQ